MLLGIKKPLVSYHEHTSRNATESIISRILAGESCALITDAGTPAVSDPGEKLVLACAEAGVTVTALPGPCAGIVAISASGLASRRFCFEGFLPENARERKEKISQHTVEVADRVVEKQMRVVQEIASLLGETAAETKIALTKLKESISDE